MRAATASGCGKTRFVRHDTHGFGWFASVRRRRRRRAGFGASMVTWPGPVTTPWMVRFELTLSTLTHVALGAGLERLAAHGEHDAGHLVVQRHHVVPLHDLGLHQVGVAQRLAGAHRARAPQGPTTSAAGAGGSLANSLFGRRSIAMSLALMISPRLSARVGTAASTVSTAVPV